MASESKRPRYSVVVPVYESSASLLELVARLNAVFIEQIRKPYEILLVDDGSRSVETRTTLEELVDSHENVRVLRLMRNYGKPGAVMCGLRNARGDWVVTLDDDLQQRPEDIPALIELEQHDVVIGDYRARADSLLIRFTSWIKGHFDRVILGVPCRMTPLKLIRRDVVDGMLSMNASRPFIPALLAYTTSDFATVAVTHVKSMHRKSRYGMIGRIRQFSNLVIGNSTILLRAIGAIGGLLAVGGFGFAVYVLLRKLGGSVIAPGWASLIVINLTFGGLILLVLAIIGEYLLRILEATNHRPPFLLREELRAVRDDRDSSSDI